MTRSTTSTHDVFGVTSKVRPDSYVDRGELDATVRRLLDRDTHVALRGVSKCGKSWLRQRVLPNGLVVQCRLGKGVGDIYRDALGQLGIRLEISSTDESKFTGRVEASGEVGITLIAKVKAKLGLEHSTTDTITTAPVAESIDDLRFVAHLLLESGRRLVVEDFHYLSVLERKEFAFDLKTLWDYGVFVVIIGVWSEQNMLTFLNPDLTGRIKEVSIVWRKADLQRVFARGGSALGIEFSNELQEQAIQDCYENVGILQHLILDTLDALNITYGQDAPTVVDDLRALETAELNYAEQLNSLYLQFARRVSGGIRTRQGSTGIYAHAMAVILEDTRDAELIAGLSLNKIFKTANRREPRIQRGNLKTVLERIEQLQVDDEGRGLVLAYNEATNEVTVVDRQLLLYRKYSTQPWPWVDLIKEAKDQGDLFDSA